MNSGSDTVPTRTRPATSPLKALAWLRSTWAAATTFWASGQQAAPGRRQFHAAGEALEQRDAQFVLERLDLGAQRRLTDVKPVGCAGQVSQLGDRREAPELVELHRTPFVSAKAGLYQICCIAPNAMVRT